MTCSVDLRHNFLLDVVLEYNLLRCWEEDPSVAAPRTGTDLSGSNPRKEGVLQYWSNPVRQIDYICRLGMFWPGRLRP